MVPASARRRPPVTAAFLDGPSASGVSTQLRSPRENARRERRLGIHRGRVLRWTGDASARACFVECQRHRCPRPGHAAGAARSVPSLRPPARLRSVTRWQKVTGACRGASPCSLLRLPATAARTPAALSSEPARKSAPFSMRFVRLVDRIRYTRLRAW